MNVLLVILFLAAVVYVLFTAISMLIIFNFSGLVRPVMALGMAFKPWATVVITLAVITGVVFGVYSGVVFLLNLNL